MRRFRSKGAVLLVAWLACAGCGEDEGGRRDGGPDGGRPVPDGSSGGLDAGSPPGCPGGDIPELTAVPITETPFEAPVFVAQAPGRPDALWVVEQGGRVLLVRDGDVSTFLDLSERVTSGGEEGLLGLAFHPGYEENGRFFVAYTASAAPQNVIAEYRRSASDPDVADPTEVARLVELDDPEPAHNGGMLAFGPDGYLYAGIGDGGGVADGHGEIGHGQSLQTLFGKILRLDVDAADVGYAAPGNPFADRGLPQIWAYGVRNPWRFSFDRRTGDFWLGDVGEARFEEIDFRAANAPAGANFGWRAYEGSASFDAEVAALVHEHTAPIFVLDRSDPFLRNACAITGGYVYRGEEIEALQGTYLFADWCSFDIGAFRYCDGEVRDLSRVAGLESLGFGPASFGEDLAGELYIVYQGAGTVLRIEAR